MLAIAFVHLPNGLATTQKPQVIIEGDVDYFYFLGNSYLSVYNTPRHVQFTYQRASGRKYNYHRHTPATATLQDHVAFLQEYPTSLESPHHKWIVVQEQDENLLQLTTDGVSAAKSLFAMADSLGTRTLFVMIPARPENWSINETVEQEFLSHTDALFDGIQAYMNATAGSFLAPVGLVYATIYRDCLNEGTYPLSKDCLLSKLYAPYENNPSLLGTYVAGLTISTTLTGYNPLRQTWLPITDNGEEPITEQEAFILRNAVGKTILRTFWSGQIRYPWYEAWPTEAPSASPSGQPSALPSTFPTSTPTKIPTTKPPSNSPTLSTQPSNFPSLVPSKSPTGTPSLTPTIAPSSLPSLDPSNMPSSTPSLYPTSSSSPSNAPVPPPSVGPSDIPSSTPTVQPSNFPSQLPTIAPSTIPSLFPTTSNPTNTPTRLPTTHQPSMAPTMQPSQTPSDTPSMIPTVSSVPSTFPVKSQTMRPTFSPQSSISLERTRTKEDSSNENDKTTAAIINESAAFQIRTNWFLRLVGLVVVWSLWR